MSAAFGPTSATVQPHDQKAVVRGLVLVVMAMIVLPGQDAIAKYISDAVSPGQIAWARFLLQTGFTLPFLIYFQGWRGLVPERFWLNVFRGVLIAVSSTLFFIALKFMPMADAIAIFFVEPFILTVLSAVIDKEEIGWRKKVAVVGGFVGVLIVVRPSYDVFGFVSLIPAAAGFIFAFYVLMNRRLSTFDTPLTMQFTAGMSALIVITLCLGLGWLADVAELSPSAVGLREAGLLFVMGVLGTGGHFLFIKAARLAPSSLIAPMQYIEIVCAASLGYFLFGDFPDLWKWLGIFIIVASGVFVLWGESRSR